MIRSVCFLVAGVLIGGLVMWLVTAAGTGAPRVAPVDVSAPVAEVVKTLNARIADAGPSDEQFIKATYREWAAANPDAALQALVSVEPPAARRAAALALLDSLGDDVASADRIASALPALEQPAFRAEWLGLLAEHDPVGAFWEMLAIGSSTAREMAGERIAAAWAAQDPEVALAEAMLLPDEEASGFRRAVLGAWARSDTEGLLAYLESADVDPLEALDAMMFFTTDPESLLAMAERRDDALGATMQTTALTMLADLDAPAAVRRVEAMPEGSERDQAVMMVAMMYAQSDPAAATSWIEQMLPASPNARMLVAVSLAEQDPVKAMDMLSSGGATTQENQMLLTLIVQTAAVDPERAQSLAENLAASDKPEDRTYLSNLMTTWVGLDPEAALGWALERESSLDPALLGNAAARLASRDPAAAAAYVERMPSAEYRDVWITRMAGSYGRSNLDEAVSWLGQYRGQAVFEQAYPQLISQAAGADPQAAARLLSSASSQVQRNAAAAVATSWAQQDPDAAVRWALGLGDETARDQGLVSAVQLVSRSESPEAATALLELRVSDPELQLRIAEQAGLSPAP